MDQHLIEYHFSYNQQPHMLPCPFIWVRCLVNSHGCIFFSVRCFPYKAKECPSQLAQLSNHEMDHLMFNPPLLVDGISPPQPSLKSRAPQVQDCSEEVRVYWSFRLLLMRRCSFNTSSNHRDAQVAWRGHFFLLVSSCPSSGFQTQHEEQFFTDPLLQSLFRTLKCSKEGVGKKSEGLNPFLESLSLQVQF